MQVRGFKDPRRDPRAAQAVHALILWDSLRRLADVQEKTTEAVSRLHKETANLTRATYRAR